MDAEAELTIIGNKSRAVLVTIRVENTDKIGDLLNYLNTHEFEYEAEE